MRRFFYPHGETDLVDEVMPLAHHQIGDTLPLPDSIRHHWCQVLRAKVDDEAVLFDGLGGERQVTLTAIDKKNANVTLGEHHDVDRIAPVSSNVAIVMSRGDRMDYVIQKSTELGASVIQLLTSEHGEVRLKSHQVDKKLAHWQQVALSACEQCGLNRPPVVISPIPIDKFVTGNHGKASDEMDYLLHQSFYQRPLDTPADLQLVLAVPNRQQAMTKSMPVSMNDIQSKLHLSAKPRLHIQLLIGAEGGLSDSEIEKAFQVGFSPWQIGERVLRTETAPVVALSLLNACAKLS